MPEEMPLCMVAYGDKGEVKIPYNRMTKTCRETLVVYET